MAKKKTPGEESGSGEQTPAKASPYLVLARKYRPATFADLIGQEAMVTTLRNAFATDRIAQGYMLTGVRGVGKTTTARILSRALNYQTDAIDRPTFDMEGFGRHCAEIMEGRHPDVLEMDAASNTGVDNMREIIESARYRPLVARYKVYLIDEVHMLSKGAFNALLKTLEEPPEHVKFIFATTEVRKVPVTVLSRTQRFDLRRVDVPALVAHFKGIAGKEGATAEDDALALIARAAQGSVRDGLSLLDQALAMGAGNIRTDSVRAMLGLADRGRIFDLFEQLMGGAAGAALELLAGLHRDGAEPGQILADLAEAVHTTTRAKTLGAEAAGEGLSGEERRRAAALGRAAVGADPVARLADAAQGPRGGGRRAQPGSGGRDGADPPGLHGRPAGRPTSSCVRSPAVAATAAGARAPAKPAPAQRSALHSSIDEPGEASEDESGLGDNDEGLDEPGPTAEGVPMLRSFAEVVDYAGARREAKLKVHLEEHVSLVKFDPAGSIELHLLAGAPKELGNELREKLNAWTGGRWMVALSKAPGERPLGEVAREREAAELREIEQHPAVAAVLQEFPDAASPA